MNKVLTIAGSDSSGGAGIQADIKTMMAHGIYGMSVITALTAQNTVGVNSVMPVPADFVRRQLEAVFDDIFPDAVKIGMLPDVEIMEAVEDVLINYKAVNVVLDPVFASSSGTAFSSEKTFEFLKERLFSLCTLVTPNIPEAEILTDMQIRDKSDTIRAAEIISNSYSCSVLIKGGHIRYNRDKSEDLLFMADGEKIWSESSRIDNPNTHGTGCTLSSSIACNLAKGFSLPDSVCRAKAYLTGCIENGLNIGKGRGPLNHLLTINQ